MTPLTRTAIFLDAISMLASFAVNLWFSFAPGPFARRVVCVFRAVFSVLFGAAYWAGALGLLDARSRNAEVIGNVLLGASVAFWPLCMVLPPLVRATAPMPHELDQPLVNAVRERLANPPEGDG